MASVNSYVKLTAILLVAITAISGFQAAIYEKTERVVVLYTSVDQVFSEPVLKRFEEETGIKVLAVYDVEAAKTTGLVNRLISEKDKPLCDVWWSGEVAQTILLKEEGVLNPYQSSSASNIPSPYRDSDWYWTGFGGRARVLIVNTAITKPEQVPKSIFDLPGKVRADQVGIAYPLFGTTATQAAALYAELGSVEAKEFYADLKASGIRVVDGNSVVRDLVADGQLAYGLTDTDDAIGAIDKGAPVEMVFLDQGVNSIGTLVIPNSVAMIRKAPHAEEAKMLIDYLLSEENEAELVNAGWFQLPLRQIDVKQPYFDASSIKGMAVNWEAIYANLKQSQKDLTEIFVR
jgi:iron(III) transport system substrate-binding protein